MELLPPIITLISDFGTADGYVGAMKGIILTICPQARIVDISHSIPPQDLYRTAFTLFNATPHFPPHTVHLAVVDPGVGTARRPLALRAGNMTYVGPDNGIFTLVANPPDQVVVIENPAYMAPQRSHTFHGRDIFAPAAAHLAAGVPLSELGSALHDWQTLSFPTITLRPPYKVAGEVLYCDHFGNVVSNIGVLRRKGTSLELDPIFGQHDPISLPAASQVRCGDHQLQLCQTYGQVPAGQALALVNSSGFLEIAIRDGNAGQALNIRPGDPVLVMAKP